MVRLLIWKITFILTSLKYIIYIGSQYSEIWELHSWNKRKLGVLKRFNKASGFIVPEITGKFLNGWDETKRIIFAGYICYSKMKKSGCNTVSQSRSVRSSVVIEGLTWQIWSEMYPCCYSPAPHHKLKFQFWLVMQVVLKSPFWVGKGVQSFVQYVVVVVEL